MLINVNYVRDKYVAGFLLHIGHAGLPGPRLGRAEQVAILMLACVKLYSNVTYLTIICELTIISN